jgi:hypothetical protein
MVGHAGRVNQPVKAWPGHPSLAPVTGGDQEEAALGRGTAQERTLPGQRLTGETPAGSAWPKDGRRRCNR